MVDSTDEPHDGDEEQEETHSNDPSDDVQAGDNAETFTPGSHANQQQPNQLESKDWGGRMGQSEAHGNTVKVHNFPPTHPTTLICIPNPLKLRKKASWFILATATQVNGLIHKLALWITLNQVNRSSLQVGRSGFLSFGTLF